MSPIICLKIDVEGVCEIYLTVKMAVKKSLRTPGPDSQVTKTEITNNLKWLLPAI